MNVELLAVQGSREVARRVGHNITTTAGLSAVAGIWGTAGTTPRRAYPPSHIALGTGSTAATRQDLELESYVAASHVIINNRDVDPVGHGVIYQGYWGTGDANGSTYQEVGLFDGPLVTDNLIARFTFSAISKTSSITLVCTWRIDFSGA